MPLTEEDVKGFGHSSGAAFGRTSDGNFQPELTAEKLAPTLRGQMEGKTGKR
jgi:hypothetical protein